MLTLPLTALGPTDDPSGFDESIAYFAILLLFVEAAAVLGVFVARAEPLACLSAFAAVALVVVVPWGGIHAGPRVHATWIIAALHAAVLLWSALRPARRR